jgi:hypothetical protein
VNQDSIPIDNATKLRKPPMLTANVDRVRYPKLHNHPPTTPKSNNRGTRSKLSCHAAKKNSPAAAKPMNQQKMSKLLISGPRLTVRNGLPVPPLPKRRPCFAPKPTALCHRDCVDRCMGLLMAPQHAHAPAQPPMTNQAQVLAWVIDTALSSWIHVVFNPLDPRNCIRQKISTASDAKRI